MCRCALTSAISSFMVPFLEEVKFLPKLTLKTHLKSGLFFFGVGNIKSSHSVSKIDNELNI